MTDSKYKITGVLAKIYTLWNSRNYLRVVGNHPSDCRIVVDPRFYAEMEK